MSEKKSALLMVAGLLGLSCVLWAGRDLDIVQSLGLLLLWFCFCDATHVPSPDKDDDA